MPALKNPRHELFCQLIPQGAKNGWSQAEIYRRCGYKATGHSAEVLASNLLKNIEVQQRIAEITAPAVRKARVTTETLIGQFDQVFDAAMSDKQFGAASSAATVKAKLTGFLRDKLEIGGPGAFDACASADDVMRMLLADQSVSEVLGSLATLSAQVQAYASDHAQLIVAEPARPQAVGSEAERSLAYLRPRSRRRR
jgi:hypothetical protein